MQSAARAPMCIRLLSLHPPYQNGPVNALNELEYIKGRIFANIWPPHNIVIIEPTSGSVTGWINLSGLLGNGQINDSVDVLNGIAYDAESNRMFVPGKLWPRLFEIVPVAK